MIKNDPEFSSSGGGNQRNDTEAGGAIDRQIKPSTTLSGGGGTNIGLEQFVDLKTAPLESKIGNLATKEFVYKLVGAALVSGLLLVIVGFHSIADLYVSRVFGERILRIEANFEELDEAVSSLRGTSGDSSNVE